MARRGGEKINGNIHDSLEEINLRMNTTADEVEIII